MRKRNKGKKSHLLQQEKKVIRNKLNQGGKIPVLGKLQNTEERN